MGLYASCFIQTLAWTVVWPKLIFLGPKALALNLSSLGLHFLLYPNYQTTPPLQLLLIRRTVFSHNAGRYSEDLSENLNWLTKQIFVLKFGMSLKVSSLMKILSAIIILYCNIPFSFVLMPFWTDLSSRLTRNDHIPMSP